jgi:hypothetical protein
MRVMMTLVILLCFGAVIYGNFHWNEKLASAVDQEASNFKESTTADTEKVNNKEELNKESFTNLPLEVADYLREKQSTGEVVELVIIGSKVNELADKKWSMLFKEELESTYNGLFNVTVNAIPGEVSTTDVVNEELYLENLNTVPDIVILEPFLLDSNGLIMIEHSLENISMMIEGLKKKNPNLLLFIQPGQPLRDAIYYPMDIEQLESWTVEQGYTYINHWKSWPTDTEEISMYIVNDDIIPNEEGHRIWAEHLINYFTGESD